MSSFSKIIDEATLLKPGDVVAVSFKGPITDDMAQRIGAAFDEWKVKLGVHFILMQDADLTVLRPVDDGNTPEMAGQEALGV